MMLQKRDLSQMLLFFQDMSKIYLNILKYCNEHRIVIVPRGAGSGFTGGALPASGGITH